MEMVTSLHQVHKTYVDWMEIFSFQEPSKDKGLVPFCSMLWSESVLKRKFATCINNCTFSAKDQETTQIILLNSDRFMKQTVCSIRTKEIWEIFQMDQRTEVFLEMPKKIII